jgi:hypothetical protein
MNHDDVADFLSTTEFSELQKKQVAAAHNKKEMYSKVVQLRLIARAGTAIFDARSVVRKQGIFIPKDLEEEFLKALDNFSGAQVQRLMEFDYGRSAAGSDHTGSFFSDGQRMFDEIKVKVRSHVLQAFDPKLDA